MSPDPRNRLQRTVTPNNVPYAALHGAFKAFNTPVPPPKPHSLRRDSASSLNPISVSRHGTGTSVTSVKSYLGTVSDRRANGRLQKPRPEGMLQRANTDANSRSLTAGERDPEPLTLPSAKGLARQFEDLNIASDRPRTLAAPQMVNTETNTPRSLKAPPPVLSPRPRTAMTLKSVSSGIESPKSRPATPITSTVTITHSSPASEKSALSSLANSSSVSKPSLPPPRRNKKGNAEALDPVKTAAPAKPLPIPDNDQPHSMRDAMQTRPSTSARSLSPPTSIRTLSRSPNLAQYKHQSMLQIGPYMSDKTLANAIQGANLAIRSLPQSRQPSPARNPLPRLPSPRRKKHHFLSSRSPSPARRTGMLQQTLRREQSASSDSSGERHGFKTLVHKHPNKHAEGDRKHWRDVITPSERKLYESLWASNKGLLMDSQPSQTNPLGENTDDENEVLDLVVREIWSRSGLQPHTLEEIWDLVDRRRVHRLTREEFVVGLWLIDQRVRGRKLPHRVADSVWGSVTGLGRDGVKVRIR